MKLGFTLKPFHEAGLQREAVLRSLRFGPHSVKLCVEEPRSAQRLRRYLHTYLYICTKFNASAGHFFLDRYILHGLAGQCVLRVLHLYYVQKCRQKLD